MVLPYLEQRLLQQRIIWVHDCEVSVTIWLCKTLNRASSNPLFNCKHDASIRCDLVHQVLQLSEHTAPTCNHHLVKATLLHIPCFTLMLFMKMPNCKKLPFLASQVCHKARTQKFPDIGRLTILVSTS